MAPSLTALLKPRSPKGKMEHPRLLNVVDLEATCWGLDEQGDHRSEIIEVGLAMLDLDSGEITRAPRILCRPVRSEVSAFCTALTGITAEELADKPTFREHCAVLARTYQTQSRPWASWGDYDRKMLDQAQIDDQLSLQLFSPKHTNAKRRYAEIHGVKKQPGMAQALKHAGLPLVGKHHRGDDDAANIAALIRTMVIAGRWGN